MISSRAKRILSSTGGSINVARGNTGDVAYLIRKGQEVVIEEDGGGRNFIVLAAIAHSRP